MNDYEEKLWQKIQQINRARLDRDLQKLRIAFALICRDWRTVEATIVRMKLDGAIHRADEELLGAIVQHAIKSNLSGLNLSRKILKTYTHDNELMDIVLEHASRIAPKLSIGRLPKFDIEELRHAGLVDREILAMLQSGIREFRNAAGAQDPLDLTPRRIGAAMSKLRPLEAWSIQDWKHDILRGDSAWEAFWDGVKIVGGVVIVAADLAGAVETLGATVISIASGAGLVADGARDLDKDVDDAMDIKR